MSIVGLLAAGMVPVAAATTSSQPHSIAKPDLSNKNAGDGAKSSPGKVRDIIPVQNGGNVSIYFVPPAEGNLGGAKWVTFEAELRNHQGRVGDICVTENNICVFDNVAIDSVYSLNVWAVNSKGKSEVFTRTLSTKNSGDSPSLPKPTHPATPKPVSKKYVSSLRVKIAKQRVKIDTKRTSKARSFVLQRKTGKKWVTVRKGGIKTVQNRKVKRGTHRLTMVKKGNYPAVTVKNLGRKWKRITSTRNVLISPKSFATRGVNGSMGTSSVVASSFPTPTVPSAPTLRNLEGTWDGLVVQWNIPSSLGFPTLLNTYKATAYNGAAAAGSCSVSGVITNPDKLSCTINNLDNGTAYTVRLSASNATGSSPLSSPSPPVTPFKPPTTPGALTHTNLLIDDLANAPTDSIVYRKNGQSDKVIAELSGRVKIGSQLYKREEGWSSTLGSPRTSQNIIIGRGTTSPVSSYNQARFRQHGVDKTVQQGDRLLIGEIENGHKAEVVRVNQVGNLGTSNHGGRDVFTTEPSLVYTDGVGSCDGTTGEQETCKVSKIEVEATPPLPFIEWGQSQARGTGTAPIEYTTYIRNNETGETSTHSSSTRNHATPTTLADNTSYTATTIASVIVNGIRHSSQPTQAITFTTTETDVPVSTGACVSNDIDYIERRSHTFAATQLANHRPIMSEDQSTTLTISGSRNLIRTREFGKYVDDVIALPAAAGTVRTGFFKGDTVTLFTSSSNVYKSADNGATWTNIGTTPSDASISNNTEIKTSTNGLNIVYVTKSVANAQNYIVASSINGGETWRTSTITTDTSRYSFYADEIEVAISDSGNSVHLAYHERGINSNLGRLVYRNSTNSGLTFGAVTVLKQATAGAYDFYNVSLTPMWSSESAIAAYASIAQHPSFSTSQRTLETRTVPSGSATVVEATGAVASPGALLSPNALDTNESFIFRSTPGNYVLYHFYPLSSLSAATTTDVDKIFTSSNGSSWTQRYTTSRAYPLSGGVSNQNLFKRSSSKNYSISPNGNHIYTSRPYINPPSGINQQGLYSSNGGVTWTVTPLAMPAFGTSGQFTLNNRLVLTNNPSQNQHYQTLTYSSDTNQRTEFMSKRTVC